MTNPRKVLCATAPMLSHRFLGIGKMTPVGAVRGRLGVASRSRIGRRFLLDLAEDRAEAGHVAVATQILYVLPGPVTYFREENRYCEPLHRPSGVIAEPLGNHSAVKEIRRYG
jgi:hypothetical protein